ncbi:uncharacterized protein ACA1_237900 [Acanthamoeba castellanii str. Neff]|uniref:Uncharacterized protein n=1 Tax=Acanthamoeba castellanii (strain ATCC 30010 / Neff) TaxID=1257118 RepID=L8GJU1_ACACF|nr:uncharacterized protein ACA1_237900 [Acanthamoeba castellanii str. Neff]ELR13297.1 hypothetical protein ACA1_237900 [Acanthamoeba castellanii str. Neff]
MKKQFQDNSVGILFFVMGKKSLGEMEEVCDVLAYLILTINPDDNGIFMWYILKIWICTCDFDMLDCCL